MESWDAEFDTALEVCRTKVVDESTHYIGIIAFRRGWVPPDSLSSVTELEFEWALEAHHPMAVFVPDATSLFGRELLERAHRAGQNERDIQAQEAFRSRVQALGTYMPFEDPGDLTTKVMRRVLSWSAGGILGIADQGEPAPRDAPPRPTRSDLRFLGRRVQARAFQDALDLPYAACIVHGPTGFGQDILVDLLAEEAEGAMPAGARSVRVAVGPWTDRTAEGLRLQVSSALEPAAADDARSPERVLADILERQGVVLRISGVQRLEGGIDTFVGGFWEPVARALGTGSSHRVVCVATHESAEEPASLVALEAERAADPTSPVHPVVLERLEPFTSAELMAWLRRWLSNEEAMAVVQEILAETGGAPATVFHKLLYDEAIWP